MQHRTNPNFDFSASCPSREVLSRYGLGTLGPKLMSLIDAHLSDCSHCLEILGAMESLSDPLMDDLRSQPWDMSEPELDTTWQSSLASLAYDELESSKHKDATSIDPFEPPTRIGSYEVYELIGEGGMGRVYKALHVYLHKTVALKLLTPALMDRREALQRFEKEMKAVGRVNHNNIVQAYDAGVDELPYLAMEFLEGTDLSRLVKTNGPLKVADACECIRQIAMGLQHAHELGFVHRDLKPSNMMLTSDGVVKMLDLGLALVAEEAKPSPPAALSGEETVNSSTTSNDRVVGTLAFIAPEQLLTSSEVTIRADLYSLGCSLFFLLTGKPPFSKEDYPNEKMAKAHLVIPAPNIRKELSTVPEFLALLIDQLLSKEPAYRPAEPRDLARSLVPFVHNANLLALSGDTPPVEHSRIPRSSTLPEPSKKSGPWILFWASLVFLCLFSLGWIWRSSIPRQKSQEVPVEQVAIGGVLEAEQYKVGRTGSTSLGFIGSSETEPTTDMLFFVTFRTKIPTYSYLFTLTPQGKLVLFHPANEQHLPQRSSVVTVPERGPLRLPKPGLYTIVAVAATDPLPSFTDFHSKLAPLQRTIPGDVKGVWRFDDKKFHSLPHQSNGNTPHSPPTFLQELCGTLTSSPLVDSVQVLSFSLAPVGNSEKETPPTPED